jgi:hypothetical protein
MPDELLLGVEEAQESRMFGEVRLDLGHASSSPILEPRVRKVVLDPVKAAFTHVKMIDTGSGQRYGPFGSFEG